MEEFLVITLCGSTRFKKEYLEVQEELTEKGYIVISVGSFGHADNIQRKPGQKEMLDRMHLRKIDMAHAIYVIDPGQYIGESTSKEIDYAYAKGKDVYYYHNKGLDKEIL